jgi:membrane protease YdiL (CAAX protease family)
MHNAKSSVGACNLLEIYDGLIFQMLMRGGLALWIYNDIKLRERSRFWVLGTFFIPEAFFILYFWNRVPELIWTCPNCRRNNRALSRQCRRCDKIYTVEETIERLHGYFEPADAFVIILAIVVIQRLAFYIAVGIAQNPEVLISENISVLIVSLPAAHFWIVKLVVGNVLVWLCLRCVTMRYRRPLAAVGLRFSGDFKIFGIPFLLAPILILISEGMMQGIIGLNRIISSKGLDAMIQWEQQQQGIGMPEHLGDASMILFSFVLFILAPVGEEILFRGIAYAALSDRFGRQKGILLSSLLFAVFRGAVIHFIPFFIMGLALALLSYRTKSIIPSIITHSLVTLIWAVIWFS